MQNIPAHAVIERAESVLRQQDGDTGLARAQAARR
jgi:hypothetical protein